MAVHQRRNRNGDLCSGIYGHERKNTDKLGNFLLTFVRSCTRILLPLAIVVALILAFNGTPMNFEGKAQYVSLQGDTVHVSRGPAAAMIAIKQLGTNGGGYYGPNSANPMENPNYFTNIVENLAILLIPIAMVFALGYIIKRRKFAWMVMAVMTVGFLLLLGNAVYNEMNGNPMIAKMGISQPLGSMEGKEVRFGPAASATGVLQQQLLQMVL